MSGQVVGYVRVSAADQNPQRQIEVLGECHKIFTDKISGKSRAKRQALTDLIDYIRDGDTVRIASMDRLGRDTRDLYNIVAEITDKGAAVEFVNENITVDKNGTSPTDSLMLGILAAFAEFERRRIKERCQFQKATAFRCQSWRGVCSQLLTCHCQESPAQPAIEFLIGQALSLCGCRSSIRVSGCRVWSV